MKNKKIWSIGLCGAICLSIAGVTYASYASALASDTPKVQHPKQETHPVQIFSIRIQTVDKSALTVKIGLPRQIMRRTMQHQMCSGGQLMNMRRG